jgi:NTP pyrophosphatase (non-canonical NTP hydrolase)
MDADYKSILDMIKKFRDDRDWMKFHDAKNMAISVILEASELLEHFQWKTREEVEDYIRDNRDSVEEEIADIAIYLFELADNLGIDIMRAVVKKLKINSGKYPVGKAKGRSEKYTELT